MRSIGAKFTIVIVRFRRIFFGSIYRAWSSAKAETEGN